VLSQSKVDGIAAEIAQTIDAASSSSQLEELRVRFFGKKGEFSSLMKELGDAPPEDRKSLGAMLNRAKSSLESKLEEKRTVLDRLQQDAQLEQEKIDVTLPVEMPLLLSGHGALHPLSVVQRRLEKIFTSLGFSVVDGPEVESDYYNFEALNIPATHPARDMQDTIWTENGALLRTHTSPMQVRALERLKPPLRIVGPGRCFRYERIDASHEHTFYQMEGMMVDKQVTVGHLIYFMRTLLREIFGSEQKIRLRPGYFPFVEPGFELDIWFQGKWMELLPCGMVHPKVLEYSGIAPTEWNGFAFGLGLSRLVMGTYQVDDIRHLQSADLRFINQFR